MTKIEQETENIEAAFTQLCIKNNIKYNTKEFYKAQFFYFNGASMGRNYLPFKWKISLMSDRPIIANYTPNKKQLKTI